MCDFYSIFVLFPSFLSLGTPHYTTLSITSQAPGNDEYCHRNFRGDAKLKTKKDTLKNSAHRPVIHEHDILDNDRAQ